MCFLIYVCAPFYVIYGLFVWCRLIARFICLGDWKGVDRLASTCHLKNIATTIGKNNPRLHTMHGAYRYYNSISYCVQV
jgi:hypothetical protein